MEIDSANFLITSLVSALVGFSVWYIQSRIEALRREKERLHDDRRKVYTDILEPFVLIFAGIKNPKENQKAIKLMLDVKYKRTAFEFSLIGSDDVVKSFNDFMQYIYSLDSIPEENFDPIKYLYLWGDFMLHIRRNVGNPKTKLMPSDMLRSQIKSIDKIINCR